MRTEDFARELKQFKGQEVTDELIAKMARAVQGGVQSFLSETGFEIWNAGCTHRMKVSMAGDDEFEVCTYDDPLHPEKEYKTLNGAISYMQKKDEE